MSAGKYPRRSWAQLAVLRLLESTPARWWTAKDIASELGMSPSGALGAARRLWAEGRVEAERVWVGAFVPGATGASARGVARFMSRGPGAHVGQVPGAGIASAPGPTHGGQS